MSFNVSSALLYRILITAQLYGRYKYIFKWKIILSYVGIVSRKTNSVFAMDMHGRLDDDKLPISNFPHTAF